MSSLRNKTPKRRPEVWGIGEARVFEAVSKADLWDAACYLGMALGDAGIEDHGKRGFVRLVEELKLLSSQNIIPARVVRSVTAALRDAQENDRAGAELKRLFARHPDVVRS